MTHTELIQQREILGLTQEEMSAKIGCRSVHTYRKWEQGQRKVPVWVDKELAPKVFELGELTMDEMESVHILAKKNKVSFKEMAARLVRKGLKGGAAAILLAAFAYYAARSEEPEAAVVTTSAVVVPAAKKWQPEPDDE